MAEPPVTVGVDTHKHIHVAVALTEHGQRLGDITVAADLKRYLAREIYRYIAQSTLVITPAPVPNTGRRSRT